MRKHVFVILIAILTILLLSSCKGEPEPVVTTPEPDGRELQFYFRSADNE